jgi:hypothetical protein
MRLLPWFVAFVPGICACNGPAAAARDFVDPYRIVVGVGSGAGVRASTLGLVSTGLLFGVKPDKTALGWKYGEALAFQQSKGGGLRAEIDQALIYKTTSVFDLDYDHGGYDLARESFFLLPALFSRVDSANVADIEWKVPSEGVEMEGSHWIWSAKALRDERFAQIHAFDIEAEVMIVGYLDVGFSPGEFVDFWTSLVGLDIAEDDHR